MIRLTKTETEVLKTLYTFQCDTARTAEGLGIRMSTLRAHLTSLREKFEVHSAAGVVLKAIQLGMLGEDPLGLKYKKRMGEFLRDIPHNGRAIVLPSGLFKLEQRGTSGEFTEVRRGSLLSEVDYA